MARFEKNGGERKGEDFAKHASGGIRCGSG